MVIFREDLANEKTGHFYVALTNTKFLLDLCRLLIYGKKRGKQNKIFFLGKKKFLITKIIAIPA